MGNLLYRKNFPIVQQITDEIQQIEHILHERVMLNITKQFVRYAENEHL
jgi:hypothetical protein